MNATNPAMPPSLAAATPLRILVADDDPVSLRYLGDGFRALGAQVVDCADGTQALARARSAAFDLLLLDRRMPGGDAAQVLAALRIDRAARSAWAPAVASSAELDTATRQALLDADFCAVLPKPCGIPELRQLLELLPGSAPVFDDAAALRTGGNLATMQALRQLLRTELASLYQELGQPDLDRTALDERLHRLRASCGFCGVAALADETVRLQRALRERADDADIRQVRFRNVVHATLRSLDG